MGHLTEEQFEDILRETADIPEHAERCPVCRARLEEKRALARRLRRAFSSVEAPRALAEKIRAGTAASGGSAAERRIRIIRLRSHRYLWSGLAAAAAVLILSLPIAFMSTGSRASAAEVALSEIHHTNLDSLGQLVSNDDPNKLCAYLESQLGRRPAMLREEAGLTMCGCCVRRFHGKPVVSYVIRGKTAPISIVAVPQSPETLGLTPVNDTIAASRGIWLGKHGCCNIASVRVGEHSYCAVGQVGPKELVAVLNALVK